MNRIVSSIIGAAALLLLNSCQGMFKEQDGSIIISINSNSSISTRSGAPEVEDFIISVTDSQGRIVWSGTYGSSPEEIPAPPGAYSVSAVSCEFEDACYDRPQYGDMQMVTVPSGGSVSVNLRCSQMNSGVRLLVDDSFTELFPGGTLCLKGAGGSLMYDYAEKRTAFFKPGNLVASLHMSGSEQTLFSRTLSAQEMLLIKVSSTSDPSVAGIGIQLDTARIWQVDSYVHGQSGGSGVSDAWSVEEARQASEADDVWVYGYIAGAAAGTSHYLFQPPFSKNTNMLIGSRSGTSDPEHCLSVELKSGVIRNDLNLMDHPENLGRRLYLRGDMVPSYYGIPGLKNVREYEFR